MSSHSSLETSSLKDACGGQRQKRKTQQSATHHREEPDADLVILTYLENIDTLPRDVAINLILVVKVSPVHLGRLIHGVLNLYRDTATSL